MLHPVHPLPIPILKYVLKDKQVATALTAAAAPPFASRGCNCMSPSHRDDCLPPPLKLVQFRPPPET